MVDGALMPAGRAAWTSRERWLALALFALAFGLRLWIVALYEAHHPQAGTPVIDEASYDAWARRIAAGDWIGEGVFFQEPLYSYLLGVLYWIGGPSLHAARVAQALIGAGTAVVVLLLARRTFGRGAGWIAGLAWACYRPALWFPVLLLKENVFCLVFAALALALVSAGGGRLAWLGVGALGGLGALLRGNLLPMLPFLAAFPLARAWLEKGDRKLAVRLGGFVFAGAALVLVPVALRNEAVGGELVLTTSGMGTNLYGGNNLSNPRGVATELDWVRTVPEHEADDWRHEAERRTGRKLSPAEVSEYWAQETLVSAREHPLEHLAILRRKLLATLGNYEVPDNHFIEWDARYVKPLAWAWPGFGAVFPLALCGIALAFGARARGWGGDAAAARAVLALNVLYLGTVVLTVTSDRIRLPLVALLLPFAAFAALRAGIWLARERRFSPRTAAFGAGALLLGALVAWVPSAGAEERSLDLDERDYNLAVELLRAKTSLSRVEQIALDLESRRPGSASVELLRAEIESTRGLALLQLAGQAPIVDAAARGNAALDTALARLARVAERGTAAQRFQADGLAGGVHQARGEFAAAAESYARALEFDPGDRDLQRRRGVCVANAAMQLPAGGLRARELERALAILEPLAPGSNDPELQRLIDQIRGAQ